MLEGFQLLNRPGSSLRSNVTLWLKIKGQDGDKRATASEVHTHSVWCSSPVG